MRLSRSLSIATLLNLPPRFKMGLDAQVVRRVILDTRDPSGPAIRFETLGDDERFGTIVRGQFDLVGGYKLDPDGNRLIIGMAGNFDKNNGPTPDVIKGVAVTVRAIDGTKLSGEHHLVGNDVVFMAVNLDTGSVTNLGLAKDVVRFGSDVNNTLFALMPDGLARIDSAKMDVASNGRLQIVDLPVDFDLGALASVSRPIDGPQASTLVFLNTMYDTQLLCEVMFAGKGEPSCLNVIAQTRVPAVVIGPVDSDSTRIALQHENGELEIVQTDDFLRRHLPRVRSPQIPHTSSATHTPAV